MNKEKINKIRFILITILVLVGILYTMYTMYSHQNTNQPIDAFIKETSDLSDKPHTDMMSRHTKAEPLTYKQNTNETESLSKPNPTNRVPQALQVKAN